MIKKENVYVYEVHSNLYINLTNKCTNNCDFCIRNQQDGIGEDVLWLKKEPTANDIIEQLKSFQVSAYEQIVFCGYGEPTLKLDILLETAEKIKKKYNLPVRINTNGQANLYYDEDVTPRFEGLIDIVSISLNHSSASEYDRICHSVFGERAFDGLLDFAKRCKRYVPEVVLTIVDILPLDAQKKCQQIADETGAKLKIRKLIN